MQMDQKINEKLVFWQFLFLLNIIFFFGSFD